MMASTVVSLNAWRGQLQIGTNGLKKTMSNVMLHVLNLDGLGPELRFNEQTQHPEWRGRKLDENDFVDIRMMIEHAGFTPTDKDVRPAVLRVCSDNRYNPVAGYLAALKWDSKNRLDLWMTKLLGAPDTPFIQAVSSKSLIASVARIMQPGCQVDTMVVLEGAQGVRKSSAIQILFGKDYAYEIVAGFDNHKQLAMTMMGAWAVELAEFVAVARAHTGAVKGLISMRQDRIVLPYGRALSSLPRRCTFWGTINPGASGYLTDDTGNRRYWPVPVTKVDIDGLSEHRDQIWAEAVARYKDGESWWLNHDEQQQAETVTSSRREDDPWQAVLREKLHELFEITPTEAMHKLGIRPENMDRRAAMRVAEALKGIGFICKTPKDNNGKTYRLWVRGTT